MSKKLVEVARSFSMKKNLGNYESVDFFASQKAEVPEEEAEKTSEALYQFCKAECVKSLNEFLKERETPKTVLSAEEQYFNFPPDSVEPKHFKPLPGEIEKIMNRKVEYIPREKMTMEQIKKAHKEMVELNSDLKPY